MIKKHIRRFHRSRSAPSLSLFLIAQGSHAVNGGCFRLLRCAWLCLAARLLGQNGLDTLANDSLFCSQDVSVLPKAIQGLIYHRLPLSTVFFIESLTFGFIVLNSSCFCWSYCRARAAKSDSWPSGPDQSGSPAYFPHRG